MPFFTVRMNSVPPWPRVAGVTAITSLYAHCERKRKKSLLDVVKKFHWFAVLFSYLVGIFAGTGVVRRDAFRAHREDAFVPVNGTTVKYCLIDWLIDLRQGNIFSNESNDWLIEWFDRTHFCWQWIDQSIDWLIDWLTSRDASIDDSAQKYSTPSRLIDWIDLKVNTKFSFQRVNATELTFPSTNVSWQNSSIHRRCRGAVLPPWFHVSLTWKIDFPLQKTLSSPSKFTVHQSLCLEKITQVFCTLQRKLAFSYQARCLNLHWRNKNTGVLNWKLIQQKKRFSDENSSGILSRYRAWMPATPTSRDYFTAPALLRLLQK